MLNKQDMGRNADGTFTKGSEAAKEAGHKGGVHSHEHNGGLAKEEKVSELEVQSEVGHVLKRPRVGCCNGS